MANFHARVWCGWTIIFEYLAAFIKLVESNFAAGYGTGGSEELQVQKHLFRACHSVYKKRNICQDRLGTNTWNAKGRFSLAGYCEGAGGGAAKAVWA